MLKSGKSLVSIILAVLLYASMLTGCVQGNPDINQPTGPAEDTVPTNPTEDQTPEEPTVAVSNSASASVVVDSNNKVSGAVSMSNNDGSISAAVPTGVKLAEGTTELKLSVNEVEDSKANITLNENEVSISVDVHMDGVAADNDIVMAIVIKQMLSKGLNMGNYRFYHVENGETVEMTLLPTDVAPVHNNFTYDPATGDVTLYLKSFSEVAYTENTVNAWNGDFDYTWYDPDAQFLTISNADQLAAFGAIVGGMAKDKNGEFLITYEDSDDVHHNDNFEGKTVKLLADINLGDDEEHNNENLIFYPIGYYNSLGTYEKQAGVAVSSTVYSFEGTFDGNGHTIANFYQNTWEMFGDYNSGYSGTPNHYKDAMGLFGYVVNGTIMNLTVDNFSSDGEFTPTGVIAAYAVNSTFKNIAITDCNPRVYNTGNGGIVGIGGNSNDPDAYELIFTNITIDNSNKITALWGSWDVACGGLVGMFRGAGHVYMTNCHVAAQIDVFNDVCGNYQYYWYRYAGMMIGTNYNMITDANGYTVPETDKFHPLGCTVHFGDWNDYYYCELVANSLASYTHDHQFSRLEIIESLTEIYDGENWLKTGNFLLIEGETKTCYHIIKDVEGNLKRHEHKDAGDEVVDGETVLKEDKQIVYLPFNQLFTGYGWGVKHIPINDYASEQIRILDRDPISYVKFEPVKDVETNLVPGDVITIGELFVALKDAEIVTDNVMVFVSPADNNSTVSGVYRANTDDWTLGELVLTGEGSAIITITDYNYCKVTLLEVIVAEEMEGPTIMDGEDHVEVPFD